jgi:hypothetical protein
MHPARDLEFGYHFVRIRLAELLVEGFDSGLSSRSPDERSASASADEEAVASPFTNWTREQWHDYFELVEETVKLALRRDATVELSGPQDEYKEDDTEMPEPKWLGGTKQRLLDCIAMNAALAPIRQELVGLLEVAADDDRIDLQDEASFQEFVYVAP